MSIPISRTKEYIQAARRKNRAIPKPCYCGEMGVVYFNDAWACERCIKIEKRMAYWADKLSEREKLKDAISFIEKEILEEMKEEAPCVGDSLKYLYKLGYSDTI